MNDRYREKVCPVCMVTHRKRNEYCSISCANRARKHTESTKQKLSEKRREYLQTPEGIATLKKAGELKADPEKVSVPIDDYAVDIPDIPELPDGYDIADRW